MKAVIYNGPHNLAVEDRPQPKVKDGTDAVVKLIRTTICGSDLHIEKGDVPSVPAGRVLGHEGVGVITEVGDEVKNFKKGDKVLIACITSCSTCTMCKKNLQAHCKNGGWMLGNSIDGTQAEFVRIVHADASLYHIKPELDERQLLVFSDILPTGLEVGVLRGGVKPGCTVAIVGAGPVGLAALINAQLYSAGTILVIDKDDKRLEAAKKLGATHTLNPGDLDAAGVKEKTKEHHAEIDGFDVVIEAVGIPATFDMCQELVGLGGSLANVGVHGTKVDLHIEKLWIRSIKMTTALVDANTVGMLLKLYEAKKLDVSQLITHDFKFENVMEAYDIFRRASETGSLKVNIEF